MVDNGGCDRELGMKGFHFVVHNEGTIAGLLKNICVLFCARRRGMCFGLKLALCFHTGFGEDIPYLKYMDRLVRVETPLSRLHLAPTASRASAIRPT